MGRVSRFLFGIGCVFLACRAAFAADSPLPKDERAVVITARILTIHGPIPAELEKKLMTLQRDPKKPKETRKIAEVVDAAPLEAEIRKTVFRRKAKVYTLSDTMHTLMGHQASLARGAELPPEVVNRPREIRWASGIMLECEERDDLPKANRATSRYFLMSLKLVEPVDTH